MKIIDLTEDKKDLFCLCLEDWSEEAKEAGPKRRQRLDRGEKLGLRAKLAVDDNGVEGGMIQYGPIEHSNVGGEGLVVQEARLSQGRPPGHGGLRPVLGYGDSGVEEKIDSWLSYAWRWLAHEHVS